MNGTHKGEAPPFEPELWRSLLFVPGARPDRFQKAAEAGADLVCIDLEDAVLPQDKDKARAAVFDFVNAFRARSVPIGVRINAIGTAWAEADLESLQQSSSADFAMLPKPSQLEDIDKVAEALGRDRLIVVMETARSLGLAEKIADHQAVCGGIYGAIDLAGEIGCNLSWDAHLYGRSRCAAAFGAAQKILFDVPHLDVRDTDDLKESTRRAKTLGIHARAAIHPAQIPVIHEALAPTAEEIKQAQRVVDSFESSEGGVTLLDGKMVELPVVKAARRALAAAARR